MGTGRARGARRGKTGGALPGQSGGRTWAPGRERPSRRRAARAGDTVGAAPGLGEEVQMPRAPSTWVEAMRPLGQALWAPRQPPGLWSQRPQDSSGPESRSPVCALEDDRSGVCHRENVSVRARLDPGPSWVPSASGAHRPFAAVEKIQQALCGSVLLPRSASPPPLTSGF